ncbi:hypothetical protein [Streptomyces sp. NPDC054987]
MRAAATRLAAFERVASPWVGVLTAAALSPGPSAPPPPPPLRGAAGAAEGGPVQAHTHT